jgi:ABC-type sugar transport system permease subunit
MNENASSVHEIPSRINVRGSILIFSGFLLEKLGLLGELRLDVGFIVEAVSFASQGNPFFGSSTILIVKIWQ